MKSVKVGIVGCGYWGQNLLRNFCELEESEVAVACDFEAQSLLRAQRRYPFVATTQKYSDILDNPALDAVVIATPASTHYSLARQALLAGKNVLVEKPIAQTTGQVLELIALAENAGKTLMVDHTFLYTSAVRKMKSLIQSGEVGELFYFDSVRISLGLVQSDINVLWDLGPHDFSIMEYLCDKTPLSVCATAVRHLDAPLETTAYVSVRCEQNFIAHFHLNW